MARAKTLSAPRQDAPTLSRPSSTPSRFFSITVELAVSSPWRLSVRSGGEAHETEGLKGQKSWDEGSVRARMRATVDREVGSRKFSPYRPSQNEEMRLKAQLDTVVDPEGHGMFPKSRG